MKTKKDLPKHPVVDNLRKIMKDKEITQRTLSDFAGMDESQFSRVLNGKIQIGIWQLEGIARGLGLHIQDLFTYPDGCNQPKESTGRLADSASHSSDLVLPQEVWKTIQMQAKSLASKDEQISELICTFKEKQAKQDRFAIVADSIEPYNTNKNNGYNKKIT